MQQLHNTALHIWSVGAAAEAAAGVAAGAGATGLETGTTGLAAAAAAGAGAGTGLAAGAGVAAVTTTPQAAGASIMTAMEAGALVMAAHCSTGSAWPRALSLELLRHSSSCRSHRTCMMPASAKPAAQAAVGGVMLPDTPHAQQQAQNSDKTWSAKGMQRLATAC